MQRDSDTGSSLTDNEAVASGFDDFERDSFGVIDAEDALDLS